MGAEKNFYIKGGRQKAVYEAEDVERCNCPLCGKNVPGEIYRERKSLVVVKCGNCGLIYVNPRVKEAETNYWGDEKIYLNEAQLIFSGKKKHHRDPNYENELQYIKKLKPKGRLVDIGCAMGFFLRKAREAGYETTGVEPSPSLSKIAKEQFRLNIINSYFEDSTLEEKSADIITMIDVFEHVTNPDVLLRSAKKILKDDGLLCIKVPNGNYNLLKLRLAKLSGRENKHDLFDSYEHVVHYTKSTMKKMLEQNGFSIKKIIIPLPIHPPLWASLVGHYYQYPSPPSLDWKRIFLRKFFYSIGKTEHFFGMKTKFAPDLLFFANKNV